MTTSVFGYVLITNTTDRVDSVADHVLDYSGSDVSKGIGYITVTVLDELLETSATVDIYRDGQLMDTGVSLDGATTIKLEFGNYQFIVTNDDYDQWSYEVFPSDYSAQSDHGIAELTAEHNTLGYIIYGDYTATDNTGFDSSNDISKRIALYAHGDISLIDLLFDPDFRGRSCRASCGSCE